MIIVGAGGFAKELISCLNRSSPTEVRFFDDTTSNSTSILNNYQVLKTEAEVQTFFTSGDKDFTIGIGNPLLREKLYNKFIKLGGNCVSVISDKAFIGGHDVQLGEGVNILPGVNISNGVQIGKCTMIYYNSNITHDCYVGEFVEISPGVSILGRASVGNYTTIGSGAIILPDIKIGANVTIGAGAVVTKNVKSGLTVVGVPAKPV